MRAHIPATLLKRICARPGEHLLHPQEIDELRAKIHSAIDDAALITARHTVFISNNIKEPHQGIEIRIVLKLQGEE